MRKTAVVLIILSLLAIAWFYLRTDRSVEIAVPVRADVTLRSTGAGDVVGFIAEHGARAWLGIPYAAPPVGPRRWRQPQPPLPWSGVREALSAGAPCPQKPSLLAAAASPEAAVIGSEDCLYLNVWAPANARRLPVMLWIHGGGNTIGSGDGYVGAHLAVSQNVVVITINYRLGPLGWFAHAALAGGEPVQNSGNYGTLDVIRALEWTRDNAAAFGGDPDNVTVFGESAGAADTLAMMASPLASGLLHRAISQSGGFSPTPMSRARNSLEEGGHPGSGPEIVNRLLVADGTAADRAAAQALQLGMSAADIKAYLYGKTADEIFTLWDNGGFGMIDVPTNFGDGHVLPAMSSEEIFANAANHNRVPVMLGSNRDEPALFTVQNPQFVDTFLWIFPRLKDEGRYLRMIKYGALAWKARGVDELADYMTAAGNADVFAYRFDWDEEGSMAGYDLSKALGAAHFLEVPFVFGDFVNFPLAYLYASSPGKEALSAAMMSYWAEFAYSGDPARGREQQQPPWLRWGTDGMTSLVLDTPEDRGIRMMDERVTRNGVVAALANDPEITTQEERCTLYVSTFLWDGQFDRDEYANLGAEGCAQFDPDTLVSR